MFGIEDLIIEINRILEESLDLKKPLIFTDHLEKRWNERVSPFIKEDNQSNILAGGVMCRKEQGCAKFYFPVILEGKRRFLVFVSNPKMRVLKTLYLN